MSAARVIDGARASRCWVVQFGDREKNFSRKAYALAWLRQQTKDTRLTPVTKKVNAGSYIYYGPGASSHVAKATINRVSFASLKARENKPLFEGLDDAQ